ncbi:MAG TPA: tetratricopeptide repeat protein, partial [Thermoanaerobaculia bacterium]|nr:tetratricopeptide repeat protein [Thermoanaerobaculia bacterium]
MKLPAILLLALCATSLAAQTRLASDFEIAQMELQLARSRDFEAQLSGRLNLGDLRAARNELSLARVEYRKALDLAERERLDARRDSSLSRYANATSYAALAQAKLGRDAEAFALLEETARYASDDAEGWNLYASAMRTLGHPRKALSAARNAVAIAVKPLDRAIYQHALATALIEADEFAEAETLLVTVTNALRSRTFESLQRDVARQESFEVYSSARGDVAAYVSLLNRAQLRLASLYERRGATDRARSEYERVLAGRSDDVTALAALARLARSDAERERYFAEAFDANPFSMALIREYQRHEHPSIDDVSTTGARVRQALAQLARGETRAARTTLDELLVQFPANDTLRTLRRESEGASTIALPSANPTAGELRALLDAFERLTSEQRVALDQAT